MQHFAQYQLELMNELRARQMRQAEQARRVGRRSPSIRRVVGASIVRIGARLAGEPPFELARSR